MRRTENFGDLSSPGARPRTTIHLPRLLGSTATTQTRDHVQLSLCTSISVLSLSASLLSCTPTDWHRIDYTPAPRLLNSIHARSIDARDPPSTLLPSSPWQTIPNITLSATARSIPTTPIEIPNPHPSNSINTPLRRTPTSSKLLQHRAMEVLNILEVSNLPLRLDHQPRIQATVTHPPTPTVSSLVRPLLLGTVPWPRN